MAIDILIWLLVLLFIWTIVLIIISKKNRKRNLYRSIFLLFLILFSPIYLEDFLFFQFDAKKLLKEDSIVINNHFKILSHQIVGIRNIDEIFELKISNEDKNKILEQIKNSIYLRDSLSADSFENYYGFKLSKKIYCDYNNSKYFGRMTYKEDTGYHSIFDNIWIDKNENLLTFWRKF